MEGEGGGGGGGGGASQSFGRYPLLGKPIRRADT